MRPAGLQLAKLFPTLDQLLIRDVLLNLQFLQAAFIKALLLPDNLGSLGQHLRGGFEGLSLHHGPQPRRPDHKTRHFGKILPKAGLGSGLVKLEQQIALADDVALPHPDVRDHTAVLGPQYLHLPTGNNLPLAPGHNVHLGPG